MRGTTTLVLVVTTIGLGAYVSLVELRRPTPQQREDLARQLLDLDPDAVQEIGLALPAGSLTLTREADGPWRIAPEGFRADGALVDRLLADVAPLRVERTLASASPLDPASFGLAPPEGTLTFVAGGARHTLLLGQPTAVGNWRYLKRPDSPDIHTVSPALFDDANRSPAAYRDTQLVDASAWDINALEVRGLGHRIALRRAGQQWRLTEPLEDTADRSEVTMYLNRLGGIRIRRFVDDHPQVEHAAAWGFEQPMVELLLERQEARPQRLRLVVGASVADDATLVYAKRDDEPPVYAVARADAEALLANPHGLRARAPFTFFTADVRKVEAAREGGAWAIAREGGAWQEDGGAGRPLDAARVDELLRELADLRLSGFEDEAPQELARYGLDPPSGRIEVWVTGREEPERLLLGAPVAGGASRYGRIEGRPAIVRLPPEAWALVSGSLEALLPASAPAQADEAPGAEHPLDHGQVDQPGEDDRRPPEEVAPERPPGDEAPSR